MRRAIAALDTVIGRAWQEAESDLASEMQRASWPRRLWLRAQYGAGFLRMALSALYRHEVAAGPRLYGTALRHCRSLLVGGSVRFVLLGLTIPMVRWDGERGEALAGAALALAYALPLIWFAQMTLGATSGGHLWQRRPFALRARAGLALATLTGLSHLLLLPVLARLMTEMPAPAGIRPAFARHIGENAWLLASFVREGRFDLATVVASDMLVSIGPAVALAVAVCLPLIAQRYLARGAPALSRLMALALLLPLFSLQLQAFPASHRLSSNVLLTLSLCVMTGLLCVGVYGVVLAFRQGLGASASTAGNV